MENQNFFDKFSSLMDQNIRGVQYGVYGIAGLGLAVAMRSVRPFKKFKTPADIPKHFVENRMRFNGKILRIEGGKTPTLFVDHFPVIPLPPRSSHGLPVQISSVEVTPNGTIWLNSVLQDSDISFIPLKTEKSVESIVYRERQDVGKQLVAIGFATVAPLDFSLDKEKVYTKYYKSLIAAEEMAEKKGAGIWQEQRQTEPKEKVTTPITMLRIKLL